MPDGPVVSLNDLAILIGNQWKPNIYKGARNEYDQSVIQNEKEALFVRYGPNDYVTPIGTVLKKMSEAFISGLIDGRNALFRRYVPKATVEDVNDWPTDLKQTSKKGFLVSIQEL